MRLDKLGFDREKKKGLVFILAALLCGLIAGGFILALAVKMTPRVPALEAVVEIAAGTPLDRSQFREVRLPEAGLPSEIIHPGTDLKGMIAARSMVPGDILRYPTTIELEKGTSPSLLSARLRVLNNPDLRAVEIPVDSVKNMLAGMKSGDRVDIVAVSPDDAAAGPKSLSAKTIMESVPVIGLKTGDSASATGSGQSSALIVAMTKEQVENYALYREKGKIYASLRPYNQ